MTEFHSLGLRQIKLSESGELYKVELNALYYSLKIIRYLKSRRLRWRGHVIRMELSRNAHKVLVERREEKRHLRRPRLRWEDIKINLKEMGCDPKNWMELAQVRDQWQTCVIISELFNRPLAS